ncbi:MAG: hypothetical protein NWF01_07250 [Candidatus Bathyarchaeota archaeon]|nr:hypothetical protein [Candidatus Bathyarchaeota archaeon]
MSSKVTLSTRTLAVILAVILGLTVFNTIFILQQAHVFQGATNDSNFDYIIYPNDGTYKLKNMATDNIVYTSTNASDTINRALIAGNTVCLQKGNYTLTSDVLVTNKINSKIVGNNAQINGNGYKIVIHGDDYTFSKYNSISGLKITNTTIRVENSLATSISDMLFLDCQTAIEFANTNTWSEASTIQDCHFINNGESIAFRTPIGNGTGSYESSEISRCYFNMMDNSIAINVEEKAEFSNSQIMNARVWIGENGETNQVGIKVNGAMSQTLLIGVVFESFANGPTNSYAISIGDTCKGTPTIGAGVSFLGNWTARVFNPAYIWISGLGSNFDIGTQQVTIGVGSQYGNATTISMHPLNIYNFELKINLQGSFSSSETVTVRIRCETVDNVYVGDVVKHYTTNTSEWLSDDDILTLIPSENVIWAILIDAQTNRAQSNVIVTVNGYGTAG